MGRRTITQEQAEAIRKDYEFNKISVIKLTLKYNVSTDCVYAILQGRIYKKGCVDG